jgi:hypothetical protein
VSRKTEVLGENLPQCRFVHHKSHMLPGRETGRRKIPLGIPRHKWVDSIKMDPREIGLDSIDWTDLAQDRDQWRALVNTVMHLWVP